MDEQAQKRLLGFMSKEFIGAFQGPISYSRVYYGWKKFRSIRNFFQREAQRSRQQLKVLDVGCGLGANICYFNAEFNKDNTMEFYGIDLDAERIEYCNYKKELYGAQKVYFSVGNAEALDFPDNNFDILLSVEALEHLEHPDKVASEFYRLLKPGGAAIITTPNKTSSVLKIRNLLLCLCGKGAPDDNAQENGASGATQGILHGHISVKGLKEWIEVFRKAKFKIERVGRGSLLSGTIRHDRRRLIFAFILALEAILDKTPFFKNLSEDVILSLRKPA